MNETEDFAYNLINRYPWKILYFNNNYKRKNFYLSFIFNLDQKNC